MKSNENKENTAFNRALIGRCGFFCGSCPTYAIGQCSSCRQAHSKGDCFTFDCVGRKNIEFCGQCSDFPCDDIIEREKATVLDKDFLKWKRRQKNDATT